MKEESQILFSSHPDLDKIIFYPNPASDCIYFQEEAKLSIYSSSGLQVKSLKVDKGGRVDCSDLPTGLYLVVLGKDNAGERHKLVIQ